MEEINDIALYGSIKRPLLYIISQYFPYEYNLRLGYRSKRYQSFHNFTFETYKYLNLLSRTVNFEYTTAFFNIESYFIRNPLDFFPLENLRNANLIAQWFFLKRTNPHPLTEELFEFIFKINLHLHHYPYIIISNQAEYDYYLKFKKEFKDSSLFINQLNQEQLAFDDEDEQHQIPINLSSTENIVYLSLDHPSYFELPFPKLKYLILSQMEKKYTSELNKMASQLEFLIIHCIDNICLQDLQLNSIKYLAIDAECFVNNNNFKHLSSNSFPELLSFSLNRYIHKNDNMTQTMDFLLKQKYSFPKGQFPKLKHLDMFEKNIKSKLLPKLVVISNDWITKERESGDIALPPILLDQSVEYWESLKATEVISSKSSNDTNEFMLNTLIVSYLPQSIETVALPHLTHLKLSLTEVKDDVLKTLFQNIHKTITHLELSNFFHKSLSIVFSFQLPNLKDLRLNYRSGDVNMVKTVFNHASMKTLNTLSLTFIDLIGGLEELFKSTHFDSLESFYCTSLDNVEQCLINTHMPLLKTLKINIDKLIGDVYSAIITFEKLEFVDLYIGTYVSEIEIRTLFSSKEDILRRKLKHLALISINDIIIERMLN